MDGSELRSLAADLGRASTRAEPMAKLIVAKTARDIERDAKLKAPRDPARPPKDPSRPVTGKLKGSIGADINGLDATIDATSNYAFWQEVGTDRMPARPFMGPAADRNQGPFEQAMEQLGSRLFDG